MTSKQRVRKLRKPLKRNDGGPSATYMLETWIPDEQRWHIKKFYTEKPKCQQF